MDKYFRKDFRNQIVDHSRGDYTLWIGAKFCAATSFKSTGIPLQKI